MKVFKIRIDDDESLGMDAISLVESPAVEVNFLVFNKDRKLNFTSMDEEKKEITGVVCLADTPIYRVSKELGEHYIVFEKDTIKKMILRYFKNGLSNQVNIEHQGPMIKGLTMIESYIKDSSRNISPVEFEEVPDGSWICTYKVDNDAVWEEIKQNHTLKGFSLQGWFSYGEDTEVSESDDYEAFLDEIYK